MKHKTEVRSQKSEAGAEPSRIVMEARAWIDTPWREQACVKGHGCDCAMLVRGVGEAAGGLVVDPAKAAPFRGYGRRPRFNMIIKACDTFLTRLRYRERAPGDVLCFNLGQGPQHLGILTSASTIVHADEGAGKVVETGIAPEFRPYPAAWRYPGII